MSASVINHKVCVVGAGPCGLTAIQNLKRSGIDDIVCHEAQESIGGLWAYSPDPNRPSVYDSAHIISSRALSAFRDFPMPDDYPDYPSHRQILAYFDAYAEQFGLKEHIQLNSRIERAERRNEGGWSLKVSDADGTHEETADYLIVAAGHHRIPFLPPLASEFEGEQLHSLQYRTTQGFEGKRVLVVGAGNSACDIAAVLSRVCDHVSLSVRTPQYIVPKLIMGRPVDIQYRKLQKFPRFLRKHIMRLAMRVAVGSYERYGLPQPDTEVLASHPTLNTDILEQLVHGTVKVRGATQSISGNKVQFADSSFAQFDTIIWATGYMTQFPFLTDPQFDWSESLRLPLYMKIMPPHMGDVFFVGLIQPLGCIWALADYQSAIVARAINGNWKRPADISKRLAAEHAHDAATFRNTIRHAVEVDFHDYLNALKHELEL